jgi:hypothetical protein
MTLRRAIWGVRTANTHAITSLAQPFQPAWPWRSAPGSTP